MRSVKRERAANAVCCCGGEGGGGGGEGDSPLRRRLPGVMHDPDAPSQGDARRWPARDGCPVVASATSKSSTPATCSTMLLPVSSQYRCGRRSSLIDSGVFCDEDGAPVFDRLRCRRQDGR